MLELSNIGVLTAFAAGAISFLCPCVLPLVPAYVSYVAGESVNGSEHPSTSAKLPVLGLSLFFGLGFSTVFVILGASATALGQLLLQYRYETNIVGGVIVVALGLSMMGLLRLPWFQRELRLPTTIPGGRPLGAYVLGLAFAFGWTRVSDRFWARSSRSARSRRLSRAASPYLASTRLASVCRSWRPRPSLEASSPGCRSCAGSAGRFSSSRVG
jgi:hypothetical protein